MTGKSAIVPVFCLSCYGEFVKCSFLLLLSQENEVQFYLIFLKNNSDKTAEKVAQNKKKSCLKKKRGRNACLIVFLVISHHQ